MFLKRIAAIFFLTVIIGCQAQIDNLEDRIPLLGLAKVGEFDRPTVKFISPLTNERNVQPTSNILLTFSQPMDRLKTEQGTSVTGGEANIRYNWLSDSVVELIFRTKMSVGKRYEVRLDKNLVKDGKGNFLAENYLSYFYTIGTGPFPSIATSDPVKSDNVFYNWPIGRNLSITFSEPMDEGKTNSAISISGGPAVFIKSWNSDSTVVTLLLQNPLDKSTMYTLRVTTAATNKNGVRLDSDYLVLFNTGGLQDYPGVNITASPLSTPWPSLNPEPAINYVNGVSKNDVFLFTFTKPMDQYTTQNSISFSPTIDGQFNWLSPSLLQFRPSSRLTANQTYRLTITKSAIDSVGLPLANSYITDFLVDNPNDSGPITLQSISGHSVSNVCVNSTDTNPNVPATPIDTSRIYNTTVTSTGCALKDYVFELTFNTPNGCPLLTNGSGDIFNQISVSYFSGGPISTPSIYSKNYNPPITCSSNTPFQFSVKNLILGVQYKVTIRGGSSGVTDINGNTLANDIFFLFQRL